MNLTQQQKQDIIGKSEILENIKPILKTEFIGIDNAIDSIINAMRPFFIFPKSLKRPIVVSLWGMTSCGKTHLIQRIIELLEMQSRFIRFDVGEYTGSDYRLRNELSNETTKIKDKNVVIVFDEFQLGRTIDEKGLEIHSNSMRPVWDLLDSGKIQKINSTGIADLYRLIDNIETCIEFGVEIENGVVVKNFKQYESIFKGFYMRPIDYKVVNWEALGVKTEEIQNYMYDNYSKKINGKHFEEPYFIKYDWFQDTLFEANKAYFNYNEDFEVVREDFFSNKNLKELHRDLKTNLLESKWMMTEHDYSQCLIFCLGNIDEAYHMHESSDPDADADVFYEHSRKITVPKIKEALSKRFRMEQIGRLGNNHILYPAFNKNSYNKIIDKHIKIREKYFKNEFDIEVVFDKSVCELMFKEGVFPTQGVRPLLSTFNTIIDSYVSKIISDLIIKSSDTKKIIWKFSFKKEKHIIKTFDLHDNLDITLEYDVKLNLENLRKTDYSESQAFTAVHEAGHAIVGCVLGGFLPKEIVSKTASVAEGFCAIEWPEIGTKDIYYKQIMVAIGGIECEKLIFGENMVSSGAFSDLKMATTLASKMFKIYGMGSNNFISNTDICEDNEYMAIHDRGETEKEIMKIIKSAEIEVKKCLVNNKLFILEVAEYLSNNSRMDTEQFKSIAIKFVDESLILDKNKYYNFRKIISEQKEIEIKREKTISYNYPNTKSIPNVASLNKESDKRPK